MAQVPPEDVKQALLALYVPTELAASRLASLLPVSRDAHDTVERAQLLRGRLLDAIEMMRPASHASPSATASRAYDCLRLRYVSGLRVDEVAQQLALSPRQVYRDLGWAEEQLAQLLDSACPPAAQSPEPDLRSGALADEVRYLAHKPESVRVTDLLSAAVATVAPLAQLQGITVSVAGVDADTTVALTPVVVRHALTLVLSAVVQNATSPQVQVTVGGGQMEAEVTIPLGRPGEVSRHDLVQAAIQILEQQRLGHRLETDSVENECLTVLLPLDKRWRVLIVEDNPGASALYERYLSTSEWDPVKVPHPRLANEWVAARDIDAVLLDVMMSEMDGWTVLRALKADRRTSSVPVIMCSVLSDTELASALGAAAYLTKPVSRLELLKTLRQVSRGNRPD